MTNERLLELIEAYGAEPGGWPQDECEAAEALLAANPAVFEPALAEARALDAVFGRDVLPDAPAGLAERILAGAPRAADRSEGLLSRLGRLIAPNGLRWPAGAALASLMMGLKAGKKIHKNTCNPDFL